MLYFCFVIGSNYILMLCFSTLHTLQKQPKSLQNDEQKKSKSNFRFTLFFILTVKNEMGYLHLFSTYYIFSGMSYSANLSMNKTPCR